MIDTRLLGSGALSALALMLATAATPASAAAQLPPDMMIAPNSAPVTVSAPASTASPIAAMQERGRGEARSSGRRGGWNGGAARPGDGGGRSWGGREATRAGDGGNARAARGAGNYERGGRRNPANAGNYPTPDYARPERGGGGFERGARRDALRQRGAINRGDIQAPPSYGEGNRNNAGTAYIPNDNLAAQGVPVASSPADTRANAAFDGRRGNRDDWRGNNRGSNDRRGDWRGNDRRDNWADNRRGDGRRGDWRGNDRRGEFRGNDWRDNRRGDWRGNRNNWRNNWRNDGRNNWRNGRQFGYNQGLRDGLRWDRGWRDNRRFNWIGHRQANRFLFAPGPYFAPFAGHFYRPVGIGFFLDPLFFQPRFFLNDPWAFRLPPAGDRFRWVRYYDDVLLVDVFTGEVVDVIENFFW